MAVRQAPHSDQFLRCADEDLIDFEKTFIQAIVYNYDVLREYGTEAELKSAGKILTKGKDYEMVSLALMYLVYRADRIQVDGDILLVKAGAAKA